jgi:hypothetical protein
MLRRAIPLVFASALLAQSPAFDVASVKRNTSADRGGAMEFAPDRLRISNLQLADVVMRAYTPPNSSFRSMTRIARHCCRFCSRNTPLTPRRRGLQLARR